MVPREAFFTRGVGRHKERLQSFEWAHRQAGIAQYNLVRVSSIYPPNCRIISRSLGTPFGASASISKFSNRIFGLMHRHLPAHP